MAKIVKNSTLLSLLFIFVFVLIPIAQAKDQPREFSISFKPVKPVKPFNNLDFSEQAEDNGTNTASLIISNGSVSYIMFADHNGNGYYRKTIYWFDVDASKKVNYYVQFYFNNNEGYGWYTNDGLKSDVYTITDGYSAEEGIYMEVLFWFGSKEATKGVKVELYYEDGALADTYGPDDNPDLSNIKVESIEYDVKKDPFINPTPTPTPTPTPDDGAKITGYVVDKNGDSIGNAKVIARKEGETIATVSSDENGEFVLENLNPGGYNLAVTKKGYRRKIVTVTIEEDGGDEKIVIQMKKR